MSAPSLSHVTDARHRGLDLLADPASHSLHAVSCLSAHVAACEAVLEPLARRAGADHDLLAELRQSALALEWGLRLLERVSSGDSSAHQEQQHARNQVAELTQTLAVSEDAVLAWLGGRLTSTQVTDLIQQHHHALSHGPTRPHPASPHNALMRRLNAIRDHVMDAMDNRVIAIVRPHRPPVKSGRARRAQQSHQRPPAA